jgi:hypothetical protein
MTASTNGKSTSAERPEVVIHDKGLAFTEVVGDLRPVVDIHFGVMCGRVRDAVRHELDHGDGIAENHDLTLVRKLAG